MRRMQGSRTALVLLIMVVTVLALYYHLLNRSRANTPETVTTPVQDVLLKNLETSYPSTPREVLKYYNSIMECYYNEECSETDIENLGRKALTLYDQELADNQNEVAYLAGIKSEVAEYKENDRKISSSAPASSTDVEYFTYGGRECARMRCSYTIREKTQLSILKEIYVFRKDENGHWKILGWSVTQDEEGAAG